MKYKKGTFVIVPNLDELKGKPSEMQAIYLWICSHADKDGMCFPTKSTIEKEAGCSHNTVSKYLKQLVDDGFLAIKERYTKSGRNTSNEYQLLILEGIPTNNGIDHPTNNGSQTISISNHTHLTTNTSKDEESFKSVGTLSLPTEWGKSPVQRVLYFYRRNYYNKYEIALPSALYGRSGKVIKELLVSYTEIQLSYLLIVFFSWRGMNDNNDKDLNFLSSSGFNLSLFKSKVDQFEIYVKNICGYKTEFDNSDALLDLVVKHFLNL